MRRARRIALAILLLLVACAVVVPAVSSAVPECRLTQVENSRILVLCGR